MNGYGKSDRSIVPEKSANKAGGRKPAAEPMEGRERAEGKPQQQTRRRTQCRERLQHALARIRKAVETPLGRHHLRQEPGAVIPPAGICAGAAG